MKRKESSGGYKEFIKKRSSTVIKRSEVAGQKGTHRPKLGILSLVRVVIQTDEVKSRLHLIAAPPEHVISADTLTAHLVTPVGRQEAEEPHEGAEGHKGDAVGR